MTLLEIMGQQRKEAGEGMGRNSGPTVLETSTEEALCVLTSANTIP